MVRLSGNNAINVAKLQEQLAKNATIYTTGTGINSGTGVNQNSGSGHKDQTSSDENGDSVSFYVIKTCLLLNYDGRVLSFSLPTFY